MPGMWFQHTPSGFVVEVPSASYFLGDPCYAVPYDIFDKMLTVTDGFRLAPAADHEREHVMAFNIEGGDGEFFDQDGTAYSVDAGRIGLVPESLYTRRANALLPSLGRMVTFTAAVQCRNEGGLLVFGDIRIDTRR